MSQSLAQSDSHAASRVAIEDAQAASTENVAPCRSKVLEIREASVLDDELPELSSVITGRRERTIASSSETADAAVAEATPSVSSASAKASAISGTRIDSVRSKA